MIITDDRSKPLHLHGEKLEIIQLPFDSGLSRGLNQAIEKVETPYVVRMDDDQLLTPHTKNEKKIECLEQHPEIDLIGICFIIFLVTAL